MRWSYRIARISGIDVKIHVTFLLLLAWFGWSFWQQGGSAAAVRGVGFILLLFLCVLLHEFGHALAARMYGIRTPDITLLPIGGVARLERMPDNPWQELVVAVAGPAVNVVIGGTLALVLATKFRISDLLDLDRAGGDFLVSLMSVNIMLVAFNALPAFPMDGGRVLRALLAMKFNYVLATTIAARVGQVVAAGFVVAGFLGSPMLTFIGVFVFFGAQQELNYARLRSGLLQKKIADLMETRLLTLPAEISCLEASGLVRNSAQPIFPVLDATLRAVGGATKADIESCPQPSLPIYRVTRPIERAPSGMPVDVFTQTFPPGTIVFIENPTGQFLGVARSPGAV